MKTEYKGYTITSKEDSPNALIFQGISLSSRQISGIPNKCIAGNIWQDEAGWHNNSLDKAKEFIDNLPV